MECSRRRRRVQALVVAVLGTAACLPATSVAAPPSDGRAWELVSPIRKNGYDAPGAEQFALSSEDGDAIIFGSSGGFGPAEASVIEYYRSGRTNDGWTTAWMNVPPPAGTRLNPSAGSSVRGMSSDGTQLILSQGNTPRLVDGAPDGQDLAVYQRHLGDAPLTWLSRPTIPAATVPDRVTVAGASESQDRIVVQAQTGSRATTTVRLIPEDAVRTAGAGLYEVVDGGPLRPLAVLPDGSIPTNGAIMPSETPTFNAEQALTAGRYGNQVSRDGSHIVFLSPDPRVDPLSQLYVRVDAATTKLVSRNELTGLPSATLANFSYATPDGSTVWFETASRLTDDAPVGGGTYRFDVATEDVTYEPHGAPLVSSDDGSRYIAMEPSTDQLWLNDNGQRTRIAQPVSVAIDAAYMRSTPDGSHFTFVSNAAVESAAGVRFNNDGGFRQLYVVDTAQKSVSCVSCPPADEPPNADVGAGRPEGDIGRWQASRIITDDGQRVFFDTTAALVPDDNNGVRDAYEWHDGQLSLLSQGTGGFASQYLDSGADGRDVFIKTRDGLVAADTDGNYDVYDVRIGGGFPEPILPPPCQQDCQGPLGPVPFLPVPGSELVDGNGNVEDPEVPDATFRVAKVTRRARAQFAKTGRLTIAVRTNDAGTVRAQLFTRLGRRWVGARATSASLVDAGTARLTVSLSRRARQYLAGHRGMRVRIDVEYSETDGIRQAAFVVRRAAKRRSSRAGGQSRRSKNGGRGDA